MTKWADMTERERDVLVVEALGWEVVDVACAVTFKQTQNDEKLFFPASRHNTGIGSSIGWIGGGKIHWTREGDKIQYGSITRNGQKEKFELWEIPHFSTDRASAMTLLDGEWLKMWRADRTEQPHFSMTIKTKDDEVFISGMRDTFPEAICVCFLRAKGVEIE